MAMRDDAKVIVDDYLASNITKEDAVAALETLTGNSDVDWATWLDSEAAANL